MNRERILKCFTNLGIVIQEDNFLINDYIDSSIIFISLISELEQEFNIEVTDEYLMPNRLNTLNDIENMIIALK